MEDFDQRRHRLRPTELSSRAVVTTDASIVTTENSRKRHVRSAVTSMAGTAARRWTCDASTCDSPSHRPSCRCGRAETLRDSTTRQRSRASRLLSSPRRDDCDRLRPTTSRCFNPPVSGSRPLSLSSRRRSLFPLRRQSSKARSGPQLERDIDLVDPTT